MFSPLYLVLESIPSHSFSSALKFLRDWMKAVKFDGAGILCTRNHLRTEARLNLTKRRCCRTDLGREDFLLLPQPKGRFVQDLPP